MGRFGGAVPLVLVGIGLGVLGAFAWQSIIRSPTAKAPIASTAVPAPSVSPQSDGGPGFAARPGSRPVDEERRRRFRELADQASIDLVAGSAEGGPGATFYAQPLPYGESLCRIRRYYFDPDVGSTSQEARWANDLEVEDVYGYWRTADKVSSGADREAACKDFREFDHIIQGDGGEISHVVHVLEQMIAEAKTGKPSFAVTCEDGRRFRPPVPCNGIAVLRASSPGDIVAVKERIAPIYDPEDTIILGDTYKHEVSMRLPGRQDGCGRQEYLKFILVSHDYGPTPRAIRIIRGVYC